MIHRMSHDDQRWSAALVFGLMLYIAGFWLFDRDGTFALWSQHMASDDWLQHRVLARSNIAGVIQLMGQAIAAFGLFQAYVRTTFHQSVQQWASAHLTTRAQVNATAWVGFHLNPLSTARQQIKHIARFINDRSKESVYVQEKLIEIQQDITKLSDEIREVEHTTLQHIASQSQQTQAKQREHDAIDLRLAIAGLLITAAGIAFGLGA
jgi:hypothetical protein